MASAKDLKKRIGSVKNTQQTTRAMKMVSAAKLRRAQEAILSQRPYARQIGSLVKLMVKLDKDASSQPILTGRSVGEERKPKLGLLLFTSDRGLCGGFNSYAIKEAVKQVREKRDQYESVQLLLVGKKGNDFFKTKNYSILKYFEEISGKVTFAKAKSLAGQIITLFESGELDEVHVVYNEFKNAVTQTPVTECLIPVLDDKSSASQDSIESSLGEELIIVKPSPGFILKELLAKQFAVQIFRVLLESQAGEHGARMSAMENSTKNAGEMIKDLTLQYNKQRQANITKELLEIISGSEAQKAG